ncbi:MAG: DUF4836 family protein [Bacteroidota bacterium]
MNRLLFIIAIIAGLSLASCSRNIPDYASSIPDNAVAVMTLHPMQIHTKGKLNSLESLKEKMSDEIWGQILEDPLSTGLMLDEYAYVFVKMEEEAPVIGFVAGMKDRTKFESIVDKIGHEIPDSTVIMEGYKYIRPDKAGIIAWNEKQLIILGSPDADEFDESYWKTSLDWMFNPVKEESIVSLVDFKDFQGKMKDLNLWLSTDDLKKVVEKFAKDKIGELPVNLTNNYTHMYCEFADGVLHISGETNFSEEVQKNLDEFLVMNPSLNKNVLKMAPGGDLLLAMSFSMDMRKLQALVEKFSPSQLGQVGDKVEEATGIPAKTLLDAFTGDFTLAVNGLEGENMIPLELFIGFGVNSDEIQKKLMETVQGMVPVEEQGDFFVINVQGTEIYSGIINDTWVITNMKGYKESVSGGSLDMSLLDSPFAEFSEGSMGMFVNLDLTSYPEMIQGLLDQKPEKKGWIEELLAPFDYFGMSAGDKKSLMTLKTNKPGENSLYTILKLTESHD